MVAGDHPRTKKEVSIGGNDGASSGEGPPIFSGRVNVPGIASHRPLASGGIPRDPELLQVRVLRLG
jgi:hypothetical protein